MTKEERLEQLLTQLGYDEYDRCSMYTVKDLMLRFADSENQFVIGKACKLVEILLKTLKTYDNKEALMSEFKKAMTELFAESTG